MDSLREIFSYFKELKLVHSSPINNLMPILAIDGESYIKNLLQEDFYSQVLGGSNFTLKTHLTFAIQKFKEKGITPVFFFNGVPLRAETSVIAKNYKRSQKLWEKINKNQALEIEKILMKQEVIGLENLREIFQVIRTEGGEVMKAPSYAGFQLAYLEKSLCHVMGCVDLLSFGVEKIVMELDFEAGCYSYILASEVFRETKIQVRRFTEILIAKGMWTGKNLIKTSAVELVQSDKLETTDKNLNEIQKFCDLIESEFYLCKDSGKVLFKHSDDIVGLVPDKTPEHLFFGLCLIPLSSSLISSFVKKTDVMTPPIADSLKYKTLVHKYKPLMRKVYSTLAHLFDSITPGTLKGIKTYYWFDEVQPFQIDFEPVKELNFSVILAKFEELGVKEVDIQSVCKFHLDQSSDKDLMLSLKSGPDSYKIKNAECLKLKVYFKVLQQTGFFNQDFGPTLFGRILTQVSKKFHRQIYVVLELIKLGLLDWKAMTTIKLPESVLKKIAVDSSDLTRLLSRVCSLVPPTLSNDIWTSSIDHDLAQFYSMLNYISKVHQYLAEVFLLEEFTSTRLEISIQNVSESLQQLQIVPLNSVVVGILVKKVMEGKNVSEISREIPQAIDVVGDLEKAWWFWKEFVNVIWILTKQDHDVRGVVELASKMFKTKLINSGIHII